MSHRKWKMKNGQKIWIKDMEDSHLLNTLKLLQRNAWAVESYNSKVALLALQSLQGEQAIYSMENELNRDWWEFLPSIYNSLIAYAKKRKFWNKELEQEFNVEREWGQCFSNISPYWVKNRGK